MADHTLDPSLLDSHFKDASAWLTSAPAAANLSIDTKLEIYGLYKVATVGFRPDIPQPGFFSLPAAKAKYSAWQSQGEKYSKLSSESIADQSDAAAAAAAQDAGRAQAKERYLEIAQQIGWTAASEDGQGSGDGKRSGMGMAVSTMRNDDDELPPPGEHSFPLHDAASDGDLERIKQELSQNPQSINIQDELGLTPLHLAADRGHARIAQYLLDKGADRTLKDSDSMTPRDMAEALGREDILKLLS